MELLLGFRLLHHPDGAGYNLYASPQYLEQIKRPGR